MDTIKLLLGATVALLLGALAVSWQGMQSGVKNTSSDELARLEKQVKELRAEQDKLTLEREMLTLKNSPANSQPTAAEIASVKTQIDANTAAVAQLELEKAQRDAKLADSEELLLDQRKLESRDHELRRARLISDALLIGRVSEFVEDAQYGGFVTFEVLMPEQVQSGTILAIRRKTGILGQLKVTEIATDGAIASPLPGFNNFKPEPGDELILPPQF
jgi:TolA-binding protein